MIVPALPDCASQGETREEALANIREAIDGYLRVMREDGFSPPPEETVIREVDVRAA